MKQKTKVVVFSRVSTIIQDNFRQTEELKEYAERMNYQVLHVFAETISGTKKTSDRPVLQSMLTYIQNNPVQKILIWELSRIGRNSLEVLQILNLCNSLKVSIFIKNFNIETLDDKGNINPMTQFMLEIINTLNQLERNNIVQRLRSGFEQYRKSNPIGRKVGSVQSEEELLGKYPQVLKYLKKGLSIRQISGLTNNTSTNTILKVKKTAVKLGVLKV
ncbi:recombinase family protein [Cytophagaceae bacterium 50C-KIRBA]|uniref:Recombinase family protein n=1 Tax=Aquirufa beregesia TaxID=2516556 RepID=A0ABX0F122_9BACT|nr:recombinase family protein [Aquirufa beregesia]NGZ45457.1 recombinase family protein [Aquirufa beregesia]